MEYYNVISEFYRLERRVPMALYRPDCANEDSTVAVLAMHPDADYLSFDLCREMARRGILAAGANCGRGGIENKLSDVRAAVSFLKSYAAVEKIVLLGHSGGGSLLSCYQYIAENGTERFDHTERIIPFGNVEGLIPADGLMLLDNNYGIMDVLSIDPAVVSRENGLERNPELDLYLPENGYSPDGADYPDDFIRNFQKAQISRYNELLHEAKEIYLAVKNRTGHYTDDDAFIIPGASNMMNGNKLFLEDNRLLSRTKEEYRLLHSDGSFTEEVIHTLRPPKTSLRSEKYRGALKTSVVDFLKAEVKIGDDFGYDECAMWGADWDFNPNSSRANVKGISVPLLVEGNTGSYEFLEAETIFNNAASRDKSIVFLEGADHNFNPLRTEDNRFGDTRKIIADYIAEWISREGRFI